MKRALAVGPATFLVALVAGAQESPPPFAERLEVRESSVAAVPAGSGELPAPGAVTVAVDGLPQAVTRVEQLREGERGSWRFVVYLDPELAGARTRFLTALALGQRAELLAALGTVELLLAGEQKPALARTGDWQRIEAALFDRALAARRKLDRGEPALARPGWTVFQERLALLAAALERVEPGRPRALLIPSDGLESPPDTEAVDQVARRLAASGWITVAMPWSERPAAEMADRLSEFERWRSGAEGRDVAVGQQRYVIDFGRVARRLRGAPEPSAPTLAVELEPQLEALQRLAEASSGRLVAGDAELRAALADLARRWQIWFQLRLPGDGELRPLAVRLGDESLEAPGWISSPKAE